MIEDVQTWIGQHAAQLELLGVLWFIVLAVVSIPAGLYIIHVYRMRHEEAPFLTRLVMRNMRSWAAVMLLLVLVIGLLTRVVARPWGTLTICLAITIFAWGLLDDARTFFVERRNEARRRRGQ